METTKAFLRKGSKSVEATGTLFVIDKGWGYDIQPYSLFPDEEKILLEPGKRFKVACVIKGEGLILHQPRDAGHAAFSPRGVWGWWVQMKKERGTISLFSSFPGNYDLFHKLKGKSSDPKNDFLDICSF